jgi:sec-independent protein translocase protein TatC
MAVARSLTQTHPALDPEFPSPPSRGSGGFGQTLWQWLAVIAAVSSQMSFMDHLEELRKRILWSLAFVAVTAAGCWIFAPELYRIASGPIRDNPSVTLAISRPQDIVSLYLKVTLVASVFVSSPFILAQAWKFIAPGLYPHERKYAIPFVLSASLLFMLGGVFGYFIAFPITLRFLLAWIVASDLEPIIDAIQYFDLFFNVMLVLGLVFQIPAVVFVLSRIGLVDARFLLVNTKYALLICFLIGAIVTPTTDATSMLVIAGPMFLLYGVGIAVAWIFARPRQLE